MSNFFGSNPARGSNLPHRNFVTRSPQKFASTTLAHGALSFLLCAGNMRGAIHDGKTCGGAAHFPLFHPSCDFTALYEAIDCPEDLNMNGTTDSAEPTAETTLWTLFSKFPNPHQEEANYPGMVFIGSLETGPTGNSTHPAGPQAGISINGWNVYAVCAASQPADDGNDHYWIAGDPADFAANLQYLAGSTPNASPVCA